MSIAVFDSGVGGISVLKSLVEVMPNEDFIYYGDSANAPYGTKTLEQVRALTCEHAKELIDSRQYLIYEIAGQLGFDNAYYFSKVFKKVTGMSPRDYDSLHK